VRASNTYDLIYKSGQAGINRASVSIHFDNSDKSRSPIGFESSDVITVTRQIAFGGKSKYFINGTNAANNRVQDLFCSVGLNVNNPHFLIMQGQITKVLNMKPPEILAMIEEAAGTRMYETKKTIAERTIENKESKLESIRRILNDEINPALQKLQQERAQCMEYQRIVERIERLTRLCLAYEFVLAEQTQMSSVDVLKEMQANITELQLSMAETEKTMRQLNEEIVEMEKKRDEEFGGTLHSLKDALSEDQRVHTKAQSALDLKKQNLKNEETKHSQLVTRIQKDSMVYVSKEKVLKKMEEELSALQEESKKDADDLAAAEKHFHSVSAGLSSSNNEEEATLSEQMIICKNEIGKAETEAKQAEMKLNYIRKELKTKEAEVKKVDEGYRKDQKAFEAVENMKKALESQMRELNYT
ncbi:PREDICTED: structural maintenance of chromosomes protein 2, partial [Acanthisitta chloris]|uniref:structural maintenance of chromosomes protein 2 n=1 Tax=Acanthisitta chloris TaxID=57068 RepID=UPI0004F0FC52